MNKTDDIAQEMADAMAEMAAEWAADDAERYRKYKIAAVFLAERMMDDMTRVQKKIGMREPVGSYSIRQRQAADDALKRKIGETENLIEFLKNADQDYYVGNPEENKTNSEAKQLMETLADYFRGDINSLKLAKITHDISDFRYSNMDPGKTVADAIVESLEASAPDIFKE